MAIRQSSILRVCLLVALAAALADASSLRGAKEIEEAVSTDEKETSEDFYQMIIDEPFEGEAEEKEPSLYEKYVEPLFTTHQAPADGERDLQLLGGGDLVDPNGNFVSNNPSNQGLIFTNNRPPFSNRINTGFNTRVNYNNGVFAPPRSNWNWNDWAPTSFYNRWRQPQQVGPVPPRSNFAFNPAAFNPAPVPAVPVRSSFGNFGGYVAPARSNFAYPNAYQATNYRAPVAGTSIFGGYGGGYGYAGYGYGGYGGGGGSF